MNCFWREVFYLFHVTKGNKLLCLQAIGGFIFNEHYFLTLKFLKDNTKAKQSVEANKSIYSFLKRGFELPCG